MNWNTAAAAAVDDADSDVETIVVGGVTMTMLEDSFRQCYCCCHKPFLLLLLQHVDAGSRHRTHPTWIVDTSFVRYFEVLNGL